MYSRDDCREEEGCSQQPTKEELKFLELRTKLKQVIRKKKQMSIGRPPQDDYGSFFGPWQPAIAPRLLKQTTSSSLLENPNARISNHATPTNHKPVTSSDSVGSKEKAQMLRLTRDYSFLSSDNAAPAAAADVPMSDQNVRAVSGSVPLAPSAQPRPPRNINKYSSLSNHSRREVSSKPREYIIPADAKTACMSNIPSTSSSINNGANTTTRLGCPYAALSKKAGESRISSGVLPLPPKGSQSSKPPHPPQHVMKQPKAPRPAATSQIRHPKRKRPADHVTRHHRVEEEEEEDARAFSILRNILRRYGPSKYGDDDDDDGCMEVGFEEIQKEERRSAKIARKEDREELLKILVQDNKEAAKKHKLAHHSLPPSSFYYY